MSGARPALRYRPDTTTSGETMRRTVLTATALLALTGCSSTDAPAPAATTSAPAPTAAATDYTAQLQAAGAGTEWDGTVTAATGTEPDRIEVTTTIVDPRTDPGSPEAQQALAVCEAALQLLTDTGVTPAGARVSEADGSSFVVFGGPGYPDGCTEV